MEFQPEVKQALKELPPAERVVAVALKNIYEKIKNLYEDEKKELFENRMQCSKKSKVLQAKTLEIIEGKKLVKEDLSSQQDYFVEEEKADLPAVLESVTPIKEYWLVALKNSRLAGLITEADCAILSSVVNITSHVNETTLSISITFDGSNQVPKDTYQRKFELENGMPKSYLGDKLPLKTQTTEGLVHQLFTDLQEADQQNLYNRLQVMSFFNNEFIPYSLRYFLGEINEQDDDEDEEDEEDEQEDEESEEKGRKRKN